MKVLRTPDERFAGLPDFPWAPRYTEVDGLRVHHVEDGPAGADPVLLLHGEPTWSYLYRHMIPVLAGAGHRAVAPDLVGFGRSDKPADRAAYSFRAHVEWMAAWIAAVDLRRITLVCQDWGSLIGLRLVGEHPDRFARVVVANGFLPTGDRRAPPVFRVWQAFARWSPWFPAGVIVQAGTVRRLAPEVRAAYDAPFPEAAYKAGARAFPLLVPLKPDDPATPANRRAWETLRAWDRPFLTAFGDRDPIFRGADRVLQREVPGAAGQPHTVLRGAGHFIQEDRGPELARVVADFVARTA
ncbi:MAG TPA: haloalkane dehalogenase [Longimicrobiaceae bacterium]|nr:haloalkane dehalogenase [Longimicrobiaceae bacterium]